MQLDILTYSHLEKKVTSYIASLESRQEFLPHLGRHINKAVPDGLRLKNNVC